jgi:type I restriction enzyme S subunit
MTEWRECKLGDVIVLNYGKALPEKKRVFGNIPVYSSAGLTGYHNESLVNGRGIIIGRKGTIGSVHFSYKPFWCIDTAYYITDNEEYNLKYIYYLLQTLGLNELNEDSAVPGLNRNTAYQQDISFPPLPEQKAIAEVLSSLDDKIDLLTRQNKTLEDLAQTYFRKWFVEDSSEDWDVVPISSKYNILLGGTPSRKIESYWKNGTVGWINSGKVNDFRILEASEFITEEALQKSAAKLLPAGTTVIAITGATLGQISIIEYSFAANQSVIGLVPKAELSNNFIYLWLKENLDALVSRQTGGAQQHINSDDVKSFEVVVPNSKMVNLFSIVIDPMMEKISRNCFQILILQKLRDTLLPKLISGEVRVKQ